MLVAVGEGAEAGATGVLVDEQFGSNIPEQAREHGLKLAMPVEKSGQDDFDFQYGDDFPAHIEKFNPDFSKVLVRYNADGDADMNKEQLTRLKRLADWLHDNDRKFLFELLVPATDEQLASVGGDTDRYDAELRPELMRRAIEDVQNFGVEVDIWKIEGVDEQSDAAMLAEQARAGPGREGVKCVLLGRGASTEKVEQWLRAGGAGRGLHRLRDRALDLVGRAKRIPRRRARSRGRGQADRRQLPALREGLRRPGGSLAAAAAASAARSEVRRRRSWRFLHLHNAARRHLVGSRRHGDEDAPESRRTRAGVPARDATGPPPRRPPEAQRALAHAQAPARTREEAQLGSFWLLVLTLIGTAVVVTIAMFETLYYLLG